MILLIKLSLYIHKLQWSNNRVQILKILILNKERKSLIIKTWISHYNFKMITRFSNHHKLKMTIILSKLNKRNR